jgi:hypothetical protein
MSETVYPICIRTRGPIDLHREPLHIGDTVQVVSKREDLVWGGRIGTVDSFNAQGSRPGEWCAVAVNFGWCNRGFYKNELVKCPANPPQE